MKFRNNIDNVKKNYIVCVYCQVNLLTYFNGEKNQGNHNLNTEDHGSLKSGNLL